MTVHDADQENGTYFITMELLEGDPLHVILRRAGRLSPRDCARLGVQICAGLEYAHERRIVHRDIKTSNLFFTRGKVVKIMDFGLAKMLEEVRRSATVIGGTPYYMAPEQAAGENVDARADLYALGVTFFELVTGNVPFREGDVVYHHRHSPIPDPRQRAEGIPDELRRADPAPAREGSGAALRERARGGRRGSRPYDLSSRERRAPASASAKPTIVNTNSTPITTVSAIGSSGP